MADPIALQAQRYSVNDQDLGVTAGPAALALMFTGTYGTEIPEWGTQIYQRDWLLQRFLTIEPFAGSAAASICARNAGYSWKLESQDEGASEASRKLLDSASFGRGWVPFCMELGLNYLSQDVGAFVELIRTADRPEAPLVGLSVLPSSNCFVTGDAEVPVIFLERRGKYHRLKWFQVYHLLEMPVSHPIYSGLQMSAMSRLFEGAKTWQSIERYTDEKVGGRHGRAIHVLSGVTRSELESAVTLAKNLADSRGLLRYQPPVILTTVSDKLTANVATLELASLPDGFDRDQQFREYLTLLSLAFLSEYQEFAPLPRGDMGSGAQSETLDQKARLKGAAIWRKNISQMINQILPANVTFSFETEDIDESKRRAETSKLQAEATKLRIDSGEIDAQAAREIALAEGRLTQEIYDALIAREAEAAAQALEEPQGAGPEGAGEEPSRNEETAVEKGILSRAGPTEERLAAEDEATAFYGSVLGRMFRRLRGRLDEED